MEYFSSEKQSAISKTEKVRACALRINLKFDISLSPRMHQKSNNKYNLNCCGSLRVTPIACGLEAQKRHGKNTAFYPSVSFLFFHP